MTGSESWNPWWLRHGYLDAVTERGRQLLSGFIALAAIWRRAGIKHSLYQECTVVKHFWLYLTTAPIKVRYTLIQRHSPVTPYSLASRGFSICSGTWSTIFMSRSGTVCFQVGNSRAGISAAGLSLQMRDSWQVCDKERTRWYVKGGSYVFSPVQTFFSFLTRNNPFFSLSGKRISNRPHIPSIFLPVLWTNFWFFIICWTNYFFITFCWTIFFFQTNPS